ncbi:hypothetical protein E0L93_08015 [Rubrobacter taiwanensis]|jgi:peptidoglycan hydrolase CwlO-like protein|uniref:Uncharacterized protein n=1 Tax=Rubrobacter taiwanensis TaxID=185139 RepID=A0A4V2NWB4_9ACTN|nr:hypothetical protein [Rubrobacter taiwanensis]TCJ16672.1 hypothetical protein E0L93_08015 [Rubrobacter taiwanensis]
MVRRYNLAAVLAVALILALAASAGARENVQTKQTEVRAAQERLLQLQVESSVAYENYNSALVRLEELDGQIEETAERLAAAEERYAAAQRSFSERVSRVYVSGNVAFIDVLVGAESFSEFARRVELMLQILNRDRMRVQELLTAKEELAQRKSELESQRVQHVATVRTAADQQLRAQQAEEEAQAYLASLNAELRDAIRAERERQVREAREAAFAAWQQVVRNAARSSETAGFESQTGLQVQVPDAGAERSAADEARRQAALDAIEAELARRAAAEAEEPEPGPQVAAAQQPQYDEPEPEAVQNAASAQPEPEPVQVAAAAGPGVVETGDTAAESQSGNAGGGTPQTGGNTTGQPAQQEARPAPSGDVSGNPWGVRPHVAQVGYLVRDRFGLSDSQIGGYRPGDPGDHGKGLALDFMTGGHCSQLGWDIANYLAANADSFGISYIMFCDKFYSTFQNYNGPAYTWVYWGDGAHYDHVHVSFNP